MSKLTQKYLKKVCKLIGIVALFLASSVFSTSVFAQETLVDLIRSDQREAVLAAITSPDIDVDVREADGSTALLWAVYSVDHELVSALLDAGAQADMTNLYGSTPLTEAVKLGDAALVRMLLIAGAHPDSPNQDNQSALMLASYIGLLEIAELLIEHGADVNTVETFRGQTALMWAASENNPDIAELLIAHGARVAVRAVHNDWPRQMTSEPRAQYRPTGGLTALLYAARSGCYRCAVAIVEAGADINQPNPDGITPLLNSIDNRSFDIALYLLDQGAKADVWDMFGRTPLYLAVDMNSFVPRRFSRTLMSSSPQREHDPIDDTAMDVVKRLLDMGVNPNHQLARMRPNGNGRVRFTDYMMLGGTSALLVAAMKYDAAAIRALLAHGAEVDLPNVLQITPLMAAMDMRGSGSGLERREIDNIQIRAIETIDLLLDGGADIDAQVTNSRTHTGKFVTYITSRNNEGQTALIAAADAGWNYVVAHLLSRGADPSLRDAAGNNALDIALGPVRSGTGEHGLTDDDREATIAVLSALLY